MSTRIELTGKQFGQWTVIDFAGFDQDIRSSFWTCRCSCGVVRKVDGTTLRRGTSASCGCTKNEAIRRAMTKHGQSAAVSKKGSTHRNGTRTYRAWISMKRRIKDKRPKSWSYYGGKGITVCNRWETSFENFFADMGQCPEGLTLDRIDSFGNYGPGNCRWVDWHVQALNRKPRGGQLCA